jgi:hypothetical protein
MQLKVFVWWCYLLHYMYKGDRTWQ